MGMVEIMKNNIVLRGISHILLVVLSLGAYTVIICKIFEQIHDYVCFDSRRIAMIMLISYVLIKIIDLRSDFKTNLWKLMLGLLFFYIIIGLLLAGVYQIAYIIQPLTRNSVFHQLVLIFLIELLLRSRR
jgi:hypothetical protein